MRRIWNPNKNKVHHIWPFLKLFASYKMVLAMENRLACSGLFCPFLMLKKRYRKIEAKFTLFYEIEKC